MQLADELPMIYTVCIMGFATFSYKRSPGAQLLIGVVMVGLASFITVCDRTGPLLYFLVFPFMATNDRSPSQIYYLYGKDPVFHQVAYGLLTAANVFRSFSVMERELRPALNKRNPATSGRLMREMWTVALAGLCQS
jgi:dihydroceramidase